MLHMILQICPKIRTVHFSHQKCDASVLVIGLGDSRAYLLPWTGVPLGPVTWAASGPLAPWMMMNSTVSPSPTLRRNLRGLFLMMAVYGGVREGGGEREKERERKVKGDGRKE